MNGRTAKDIRRAAALIPRPAYRGRRGQLLCLDAYEQIKAMWRATPRPERARLRRALRRGPRRVD